MAENFSARYRLTQKLLFRVDLYTVAIYRFQKKGHLSSMTLNCYVCFNLKQYFLNDSPLGAPLLSDVPWRGTVVTVAWEAWRLQHLLEIHSLCWQVKGSEKSCREEVGFNLFNQVLLKLTRPWNPLYTYNTRTLWIWVEVKGTPFMELRPLQEICQMLCGHYFIYLSGQLSELQFSWPFYRWSTWGLAASVRLLFKVTQLVNGGAQIWTLGCVTPDHILFSPCQSSWSLSCF